MRVDVAKFRRKAAAIRKRYDDDLRARGLIRVRLGTHTKRTMLIAAANTITVDRCRCNN